MFFFVVVEHVPRQVELHDEDDPSHVFDLPVSNVMHLEDFSSELRNVRVPCMGLFVSVRVCER